MCHFFIYFVLLLHSAVVMIQGLVTLSTSGVTAVPGAQVKGPIKDPDEH